jgi:peptidoglycan/xylan/chitin deacetylase (PgdA/CDA1 family)
MMGPLSRIMGMPRRGGRARLTLPQNLVNPQHTLLEDFETDLSEWSESTYAQVDIDAVNVRNGTQALKLTATDVGRTAYIEKVVNWDMSEATNLRFTLYATDVSLLDSFVFNLYTGATAYFQRSIPLAQFFNRWNTVEIVRSQWTANGGADWANPVIKIRMTIKSDADTSAAVSYDYMTAGAAGMPAVLVMFDDNRESIYQHAWPYLRARRIRATHYVHTNSVDTAGYCSLVQLAQMYAAGWDIGNHTMSHTEFDTLTQEQIEGELSGAEAALNAWGFSRAARHVSYPSGIATDTSDAAMLATGMLTGRSTRPRGERLPLGQRLMVQGYSVSTQSLASMSALLDTAVSRGQVFPFFVHNLVEADPTDYDWTIGDFQAFIDYIVTLNLPCLTISDLYNLQSGPVSIPRAV